MEESVPLQAGYTTLLAERKRELKVITNQLAQCKHGARAYQKMPRHMQRRQVSSHPKRLPHSIREKNQKEVRDVIKKKKRPCRKYRRRPANLQQAYVHRQKGTAWLETHIWHAKRFHMIKQWNYNVPLSPAASGHRSTMRAVRETCLVQDTSYESCLHLEGNRDAVLHGISSLVTKQDLQLVSEDTHLQLEDWHEIMLYHPNKFPFKAIGSVRLYWHPSEYNAATKDLWLFVHPSILEEVIGVMMSVFLLIPVLKEDTLMQDKGGKLKTEVKVEYQQTEVKDESQQIEIKDESQQIEIKDESQQDLLSEMQDKKSSKDPHKSINFPTYQSSTGIRLINLKGSLSKFTLFGPKAVTILHNLFEPTDIQPSSPSEIDTEGKDKYLETEDNDKYWWIRYFENKDHLAANQHQVISWKKSNGNFPDRKTVFGLVVRDVRLTLPAKKVSLVKTMEPLNDEENIATLEHYSGKNVYPILDKTIRQKVDSSMAPNDEINKYRSSHLVPASRLPLTMDESRVPILIMFDPGLKNSPSWEVIMPSQWARVTWVALQYQGAVAGGLKQEISLLEELLRRNKPYILPDSDAGQCYALQQSNQIEADYWKRPPNVRPNFIRLGSQHPFSWPWQRLVHSWCADATDYYVLRDEAKLRSLAVRNSRDKETDVEQETKKRKLNSGEALGLSQLRANLPSIDDNSLIEVRLIVLGKGTVEPLATICMPNADDFISLQKNVALSTWGKLDEITEPAHPDPNVSARKQLKEGHVHIKRKLKRQRERHRKNAKKDGKSPIQIKESEPEQNTEEIFDETRQKTKQLWLINPASDLQMCSRKIIGYVQFGDFSILNGRSSGRGFVVAKPFIDLIADNELKQCFVLIRNTKVLTYMWTRLEVICSS